LKPSKTAHLLFSHIQWWSLLDLIADMCGLPKVFNLYQHFLPFLLLWVEITGLVQAQP